MATTKFKIDYTIDKFELYNRTETTLLSEGWKKTNHTTFGILERVKPDDIFTTWFEREWE